MHQVSGFRLFGVHKLAMAAVGRMDLHTYALLLQIEFCAKTMPPFMLIYRSINLYSEGRLIPPFNRIMLIYHHNKNLIFSHTVRKPFLVSTLDLFPQKSHSTVLVLSLGTTENKSHCGSSSSIGYLLLCSSLALFLGVKYIIFFLPLSLLLLFPLIFTHTVFAGFSLLVSQISIVG